MNWLRPAIEAIPFKDETFYFDELAAFLAMSNSEQVCEGDLSRKILSSWSNGPCKIM